MSRFRVPTLRETYLITEVNVTSLLQRSQGELNRAWKQRSRTTPPKFPQEIAQEAGDEFPQSADALMKIFLHRYLEAMISNVVMKNDYESAFVSLAQEDWWRFKELAGKSLDNIIRNEPSKKEEIVRMANANWRNFLQYLRDYRSSSSLDELRKRAYLTFPDGYFWVEIYADEYAQEGDLMQHCGQVAVDSLMYSLRDPQGRPHVTLETNPAGGTLDFSGLKNTSDVLVQVRGKQNAEPQRKYWPYILKLVQYDHLFIPDDLETHQGMSSEFISYLTDHQYDELDAEDLNARGP